MGCRANPERISSSPGLEIQLDLANLSYISQFAQDFCASYDHLDILINNAGVMTLPYQKTVDGFEVQFGTNHLGHFALTGQLLHCLKSTEGARVVTVSSTGHLIGGFNFDDLNKASYHEQTAKMLWQASEEMTRVTYDI
jgi:NAD(P)-dependent dehydrogenase (short-subunit alcohol dehydrogenase family)